jgi:hypothetical protein
MKSASSENTTMEIGKPVDGHVGCENHMTKAYADASKPLNEFRTNLGRSVTDKPEGFDMGGYLEDLSSFGGKTFAGHIMTINGDRVSVDCWGAWVTVSANDIKTVQTGIN